MAYIGPEEQELREGNQSEALSLQLLKMETGDSLKRWHQPANAHGSKTQDFTTTVPLSLVSLLCRPHRCMRLVDRFARGISPSPLKKVRASSLALMIERRRPVSSSMSRLKAL